MKRKNLAVALLGAMALAGCDPLGINGDKGSGQGTGGGGDNNPSGDVTHTKSLKSGSTLELEGTGYTFVSGGVADDVIHMESDAATGKTKIYGLKGGKVSLKKGEETTEVTVLYKVTGAQVGAALLSRSEIAKTYLKVDNNEANIEAYTVGNKNPFFMDVDLQFASYVYDTTDGWVEDDGSLNLMDVRKDCFEEGKVPTITVTGKEYVEESEDNMSVTFKDAAVDKSFELSFKYEVAGVAKELKETISVKEGYNVHDDAEMKKYFNDVSVEGTAYMVRPIEADLTEDQYITVDGKKVPSNSNASGWVSGNPYFRYADEGVEAKKLTINGNYYEVTAEKIPEHVAVTEEYKSIHGLNYGEGIPVDPQGKIGNPFTGVFFIDTRSANNETAGFKNIKITGNGKRALTGGTETDGANSYICIFNSHSKIKVDNVQVNRGYAGIYTNHMESKLDAEYLDAYDNWGPGVHGYRSNIVNVKTSYIHNNGGPGVWILNDTQSKSKIDLGTTRIENYISPLNAVFAAYQVAGVDTLVNTIEGIFTQNSIPLTMVDNENRVNIEVLIQGTADVSPSYNHAMKDVTYDGRSSSESISRFQDGAYPYATTLGGIYATSNAFFTSFGVDDETIFTAIKAAILEIIGGATAVGTYMMTNSCSEEEAFFALVAQANQEAIANAVQGAWITTIATDMATRLGTGQHAHLDVGASVGGYEVSAIVGISPKM